MNGLKEAFSRENLLKDLNFFVLLNLGLVLTAVGIVYFKNPNHFAFGGTSGLSILLADLLPPDQRGRLYVDHQLGAGGTGLYLFGRQVHGLDDLLLLCTLPFSCPAASGCTPPACP